MAATLIIACKIVSTDMNHNFRSSKCATSRLLRWLTREAKPLVHGIWRLTWNKLQWHQSKVKQKRFTNPTFSHTTQCRNTLRKLWQPFRWNCIFHSCVVSVILDMYRDVQITIYSHLSAPLFQVAHGDGWVTPSPRSPDAMLSTNSAWAVKFGKQMKL